MSAQNDDGNDGGLPKWLVWCWSVGAPFFWTVFFVVVATLFLVSQVFAERVTSLLKVAGWPLVLLILMYLFRVRIGEVMQTLADRLEVISYGGKEIARFISPADKKVIHDAVPGDETRKDEVSDLFDDHFRFRLLLALVSSPTKGLSLTLYTRHGSFRGAYQRALRELRDRKWIEPAHRNHYWRLSSTGLDVVKSAVDAAVTLRKPPQDQPPTGN